MDKFQEDKIKINELDCRHWEESAITMREEFSSSRGADSVFNISVSPLIC